MLEPKNFAPCSIRPRGHRRPGSHKGVALFLLFSLWGLVVSSENGTTYSRPAWEAPGCHLVGNNRLVRIPGCVAFEMATNACRGYCVSYAIPSPAHTTEFNTNLFITSRAACCGIVDAFDTRVRVLCRDGYREITFKSARSCACSICRSKQ